MMANIAVVVEALKALISVPQSSSESIGQRVKENVSLYKQFLKSPDFVDMIVPLEQKNKLLSVGKMELENDLLWYHNFCSEALALLDELEKCVAPSNSPNPYVMSQERLLLPPAPLLSISEQKVIKIAIEFVVCLGIYPYLFPGADTLLKLRLKHAEEVIKAVNVNRWVRDNFLFEICNIMSRCFNNSEIGPMLALRHLTDVLVALMQVIYAPDSSCQHSVIVDPTLNSDFSKACNITEPGDIGKQLRETGGSVKQKSVTLLEDILQQTYQPLVIQQLLLLQGPPSTGAKKSSAMPSWLVKACGHYLSERLMAKNGVIHVINGIMEDTSGAKHTLLQDSVWRKCKAVARILAMPPSIASSLDSYYCNISPQILCLLRSHSASEDHIRIATLTVSLMLKRNKGLGNIHLLNPLVLPLNELIDVGIGDDTSNKLVQDLQESIRVLHKMSTLSEPSSNFLSSLFPYTIVIFELWRVSLNHHNMSAPCKELLECVLSTVSSADVLHFLSSVCGLSHKSKQFKQLDTSFSMQLSGTPPQLVISKLTGPPNLDVIETTGKLVIELLQTSLESRELSGKIFVNSLHCLASIVLKDVGLKCDQVSSSHSSELLECEPVMPKSQSEYLLDSQKLYITAALCENLSDVILKDLDVSDLLDDFRIIFECHSKLGDEVQLLPGKKVGGEITGGPVSLSICCGVLSALLGGNQTIRVADRPLLASLRPVLDKIAAGYPDTELRVVAGDISICIGTIGAVWSTEIGPKANSATKTLVSQIKGNVSLNCERITEDCDGSNISKCSSMSEYHDAVQDLGETMIPVKGHGLITITKLIYDKDKETLSNVPFLMGQFHQNLGHSDSYIYLAAINALVALALSTPQVCSERVLTTLCQEYANLSHRPHRDTQVSNTGQLKASLSSASPNNELEVRLKIGEALVKIYRELSEILPHYSEDIVASLLTTVKDKEPLLRASSLSNIAEICKFNERIVDVFLTEVMSCVDHVLRTDKEPIVRQASLVVLKNMIAGASSAKIMGKSSDFLGIYRLLKRAQATECDELTKIHAQAALGELDDAMRGFIFSSEKLEKKISVLP